MAKEKFVEVNHIVISDNWSCRLVNNSPASKMAETGGVTAMDYAQIDKAPEEKERNNDFNSSR